MQPEKFITNLLDQIPTLLGRFGASLRCTANRNYAAYDSTKQEVC
jgi:hypothetical protein